MFNPFKKLFLFLCLFPACPKKFFFIREAGHQEKIKIKVKKLYTLLLCILQEAHLQLLPVHCNKGTLQSRGLMKSASTFSLKQAREIWSNVHVKPFKLEMHYQHRSPLRNLIVFQKLISQIPIYDFWQICHFNSEEETDISNRDYTVLTKN